PRRHHRRGPRCARRRPDHPHQSVPIATARSRADTTTAARHHGRRRAAGGRVAVSHDLESGLHAIRRRGVPAVSGLSADQLPEVARTAALLAGRHVQLEYVLDEGGAIATGLIAGVTAPVAVVGIAEKGYVSLELTAHAAGGHSSMPPAHTAVGMLSAAVARLEANKM